MFANTASELERPLRALGSLLAADGVEYGIVVIGGAALNLLGLVRRTTRDVDVLALREPPDPEREGSLSLALRLPPPLARAAARVARDFGLDSDWLNCAVAEQGSIEFPEGMEDRLQWRRYGGLILGLVDRRDLIWFKLHAAADRDPGSVHYQDLLALHPSDQELDRAAEWARAQDPSPGFAEVLDEVLEHVRRDTR